MDLGLLGKRAVVLGASRGLGGAVARALANEGATVLAVSRSGGAVENASAQAAQRITAFAADLADRAQVDRLAKVALERGTDILVNNSGGPPPGVASEMPVEQWIAHFQAMAAHLFHLTGLLLPAMIERRWGRILTIASTGVEQPIPNLALSNGIRASVVGWSKTLASEVAASGVTVNVVLPGRIQTTRVDELDQANAAKQGKTREEVARASAATIPAGRYGRPDEFGEVVAFLASERASYITGTRIRVDGGMIRSI
jgi:3-oxoacyl-[acyl-carrier protein] reductase